MIFATTPAPTVRPPSRIAKRKPWSIAIGWIKLTVILKPLGDAGGVIVAVGDRLAFDGDGVLQGGLVDGALPISRTAPRPAARSTVPRDS